MTDKLQIWEALATTDPNYTKSFGGEGKGFKGTAINPTYVARKLTERFGPCGEGWRFVLDDEKYVNGHKLKSGDTCIVHVVRGHLEYKRDGDSTFVATGPQFGQTTFVGENKYGTYTDEEAPKKSVTDCFCKCAGTLGMSADIFSGQWDANKQINKPAGPMAGENTPKSQANKPQDTKAFAPAEKLLARANQLYGECMDKDGLLAALDRVASGREKFPTQEAFASAINAVLNYTQPLSDEDVQHINRKCSFLLAKQPGMMTAAELEAEAAEVFA